MRSAIPCFDWLKFVVSGAILPPYSSPLCIASYPSLESWSICAIWKEQRVLKACWKVGR